jgi:hypothetical protein
MNNRPIVIFFRDILQGVKENAVEMIADVMKRHSDDVETVRAAVTALAVLTAALSRYVEKTIEFCTFCFWCVLRSSLKALKIISELKIVAKWLSLMKRPIISSAEGTG